MNPTQEPTPNEPQVPPATPTTEVPTPIEPVAPPAPQPIASSPEVTPQSSDAAAPVFGTQPTSIGSDQSDSAASAGPQKSKKKLLIILAASLVGLAAIAAAVWLFVVPLVLASSLPLKEYKGSTYTILAPEGYETTESSGSVTFKSPKVEGLEQSVVSVLKIEFGNLEISGDQYLETLDNSLTKENMAKSLEGTSSSIKEFKVDKTTYQGNPARKVTASFESDKASGSYVQLIVIANNTLYYVSTNALSTEVELIANFDKIISSFTITG